MFVLPLILILALSISTSTYAGVIECDPRFLPTYPVTGSYPIYDYDANCWAEYSTWVPRNWGRFPSPPIRPAPPEVVLTINGPNGMSWYITPVRDAARDVSVFQFSGKRLTFPIDIRPSVRPIATIELFLKVDDFVPGRFAFLFSTESYGATNRTQPGRALMATDVLNNNCSNHFQPLGPDSSTQCTLVSNSLTGFVQLVITFDQPNQRATIWLNSMFSQTFNLSTFDDLSTLTINGRAGGSSFDMPSNISLAYLRMWDRYLAPAEMRAVSEPWFRAYNRPVFTTFFPAYVLSNATSMNWTASAIGGLMTWETRQYPLLRDTSQLLGNGTGGNASVVATVNHTYSVTARVCPFPSLQYTLAPFFASTELCDLEVTTIYGTMLPYAEPLRVASFRSIPSDPAEQYICAGSVQRASYHISFSKSVRQAATMPLMEPIRPGQGYGFVDNFDGYFATGRDLQFANDTFTRLTEDRRSFRWDVNVRCSWEGSHRETVRARIPDASIWNISDDQGNPLAVDQSATPGDTRWWEHPLQTFAVGLNAVISYSTRNCSSAGPRLTFQVNFNFPVSGFNPTQDVILCNNCTLVSVTQTGGVQFYSYQILAPSLAPNQRFIVSLAINPLSSIYDAAFPWSNLARAVGLFPPMYKAVGVEGPSCNIFEADSPPISTSSSSSAAPSYSSSASTASSRPSSGLPTTSSLQPSAVPSLSSSSAVPSNRSSSSAQSSLATSLSFASSSGTNRSSSGLQIVFSSAQSSTAEHSVSAATSSSLDLASSASLPPSNQTGTSSSARRCDGQVENCIYEIISNDSGSVRGVLGSMIAGVVGFCYVLMC